MALDVANFQQSAVDEAALQRLSATDKLQLAAGAAFGRVHVIYARFSSALQRGDSLDNQERRCRERLNSLGIADDCFLVISDAAESGMNQSRPGLQRNKSLMAEKRLGILIVAEQSRLTRSDNAKSLVRDILYHGGRFLSVSENIDTNNRGWEMIVGISEIHHFRSNEDTAERVRAGQEGRILDEIGVSG